MKPTVILTLAATLFCLCGCSKDDNSNRPPKEPYTEEVGPYDGYYWANGKKKTLGVVFDKHFLIFKEADSNRIIRELIDKGLIIEEATYKRYISDDYPYFPDELKDCVCVTVNGGANPADINGVIYSNHLYRLPYNNEIDKNLGASNYIYVGLKSEEDLDLVEECAKKVNAYMIRESFKHWWVCVICTNASEGNNVELANMLHESGKFRYAEPELVSVQF